MSSAFEVDGGWVVIVSNAEKNVVVTDAKNMKTDDLEKREKEEEREREQALRKIVDREKAAEAGKMK